MLAWKGMASVARKADSAVFSGFPDRSLEAEFRDWLAPERLRQISAVAALTALLYLLNAGMNYYVEPPWMFARMVVLRALLVPPMLLLISGLAFRTQRYRLVTGLLMLSPVVAAAISFYVYAEITRMTTQLTELYLMLLWIFVVSGMTLRQAVVSAAGTFAVVAYGTFSWLHLSTVQLSYHIFWSFCSVAFGLVGGYLLESASRERFLAQRELEQSAITDELTGLYNRVRLQELLEAELERGRRYQRPFGIMVIDVDHFKDVNDVHGHHVGDELLIDLAGLLKANSRSTDALFRWGGEEFVIAAPETDASGLQAQAEKLRRQVAEYQFSVVGHKSISVGVTSTQDGDTPELLLKRADQALYRAKDQGRNQVVYVN